MKIAVEGCCHGELEKIYATLEHLQKENEIKVDLLIICGDFQSVRNERDLNSMAVPEKYREMGSFWKYYAEIEKAPVLTLFVGGNHEASNYLAELPYGGWVAPNIYYMGYANVINFGGLRIAGLSGIFKPMDFYKGHFELPPYNPSSMHSAYHVRNLEIFRLSQLKSSPPIDIMVSHDWPTGIYNYGDASQLVRFKPHFLDEVQSNTLGSPENERLLKSMKPRYWFSSHLHVKFAAVYNHEGTERVTKFLALDKCLPRRRFLQVIDIEPNIPDVPKCLHLDPEWLVILKKTDPMLSVDSYNQAPIPLTTKIEVLEADLDEIKEDFQQSFEIPLNFKRNAPAHSSISPDDAQSSNSASAQLPDEEVAKPAYNNEFYLNEQTTLMCEMLSVRDPIRVILEKRGMTSLVNQETTQLYNDLLDQSDED